MGMKEYRFEADPEDSAVQDGVASHRADSPRNTWRGHRLNAEADPLETVAFTVAGMVEEDPSAFVTAGGAGPMWEYALEAARCSSTKYLGSDSRRLLTLLSSAASEAGREDLSAAAKFEITTFARDNDEAASLCDEVLAVPGITGSLRGRAHARRCRARLRLKDTGGALEDLEAASKTGCVDDDEIFELRELCKEQVPPLNAGASAALTLSLCVCSMSAVLIVAGVASDAGGMSTILGIVLFGMVLAGTMLPGMFFGKAPASLGSRSITFASVQVGSLVAGIAGVLAFFGLATYQIASVMMAVAPIALAIGVVSAACACVFGSRW